MNESLNALRLSVEDLSTFVGDLSTKVDRLNREHRRNTSALWGAILAGALILLLLGVLAFSVSLSNRRAIEDNNRRWCPMVGVLLPKPGEPPPNNERSRVVVENARKLYREFGCA